ncbi:hypothetical protein [Kitasatospora sp. NPDC057015]|uniref:hypothetical protein n=1 Tax=Kitasatospora sp. NPDC057015 TaxID=3346001 RepID=UPI00364198A7
MTAPSRPRHRRPAPAGTGTARTRTARTAAGAGHTTAVGTVAARTAAARTIAGPRTAQATAVGALTALLALGGAPAAVAAPGDNGDVKVHESTTAATDRRDEPQVCRFYLDAFDFDDLQRVSWTIDQQPPTGTRQVTAGVLALLNGAGQTQILSLPDGHYRVNWTFTGQQGGAKHKVFTVSCPPDGASTGSPGPGGPSGLALPPNPSDPPGPGGPSAVAAPRTSPRATATASPAGGSTAGGTGGGTTGGSAGNTGGNSGGRPPGGGPHGSLDAGGGGTSHGPNPLEVGAGSALLALAGVIGIRAARRRAARNAAS